jgi:Mor family transcriptional regulator
VTDPLPENSLFDDLQKSESPEFSEMIDEVGTNSEDFEQLEDLIGAEAAWKVAEIFAGSTIYIPKSILTNKNYFDIRRKYKEGKTYRELSTEYGYSEMHIRNIIHQKMGKE